MASYIWRDGEEPKDEEAVDVSGEDEAEIKFPDEEEEEINAAAPEKSRGRQNKNRKNRNRGKGRKNKGEKIVAGGIVQSKLNDVLMYITSQILQLDLR